MRGLISQMMEISKMHTSDILGTEIIDLEKFGTVNYQIDL